MSTVARITPAVTSATDRAALLVDVLIVRPVLRMTAPRSARLTFPLGNASASRGFVASSCDSPLSSPRRAGAAGVPVDRPALFRGAPPGRAPPSEAREDAWKWPDGSG